MLDRITIVLEPALLARLDELAEQTQRSRSQTIRLLLSRALEPAAEAPPTSAHSTPKPTITLPVSRSGLAKPHPKGGKL